MTSRTFPLSRQRRRRTATHAETNERAPSPTRNEAGQPTDPATENAGARPEGGVRLPHEHDEHSDKPQQPQPAIVQAEADLNAGLQDTDRRGDAAGVFDRANETARRG
ncbi:MAG TPA: hypothetical protein VNE58_12915 [Casimicrobiaceae bacterium]|nr:hypothetical protein [Casimicrobiaceae bacterium]